MLNMALGELYLEKKRYLEAIKYLRKAEKLNENEEPKEEPKKPEVKISYKQFKKMNK